MLQTLLMLNVLKALEMFYLAAHHSTKDYALHLLYERLKAKLPGEIDSLSELLISMDIMDACSIVKAIEGIQEILALVEEPNIAISEFQVLDQALKLEGALIEKMQFSTQETTNEGIKNLVATIAENHQTNIYLLKQSLKANTILIPEPVAL